MKSLNEQTIKRLQKLAGINEIKVQLPSNSQLPPSLQKFLDKILQNQEDQEDPDFKWALIDWLENASDDGGLGYFKKNINFEEFSYGEYSFDNFQPDSKKFVEAVKKLPKSMYLGNIPNLPFKKDITRAYNTKIIFNDPKPGFFITYIVAEDDNGEYLEGYFNSSGKFIKFD
jgi:hypothetical protein